MAQGAGFLGISGRRPGRLRIGKPLGRLTAAPKRGSFPTRDASPRVKNRLLLAASNQVTELLLRWSGGDVAAREKLVPIVYDELRHVARRCLANRGQNHTLGSTSLVHEAYLRLVGSTPIQWNDRVHFFAVAAQLMRRILVDHARMKGAKKRGGNCETLLLDEEIQFAKQRELDLVALDDALIGLAAIDERQARLVELRFFAGLSIEETSEAMEISTATVKREWATARIWLLREMNRNSATV
jgi:RNA polymerase sigma factor (TIGR02999 family)